MANAAPVDRSRKTPLDPAIPAGEVSTIPVEKPGTNSRLSADGKVTSALPGHASGRWQGA